MKSNCKSILFQSLHRRYLLIFYIVFILYNIWHHIYSYSTSYYSVYITSHHIVYTCIHISTLYIYFWLYIYIYFWLYDVNNSTQTTSHHIILCIPVYTYTYMYSYSTPSNIEHVWQTSCDYVYHCVNKSEFCPWDWRWVPWNYIVPIIIPMRILVCLVPNKRFEQ